MYKILFLLEKTNETSKKFWNHDFASDKQKYNQFINYDYASAHTRYDECPTYYSYFLLIWFDFVQLFPVTTQSDEKRIETTEFMEEENRKKIYKIGEF